MIDNGKLDNPLIMSPFHCSIETLIPVNKKGKLRISSLKTVEFPHNAMIDNAIAGTAPIT
jgi:hypothetical protein